MRIFSRMLLNMLIVLLFLGRLNASEHTATGTKAMVVTECSFATEVGVNILKNGGNSIDAAVAVAFTMAVTFPEAGNLGGGGFMVIKQANGFSTTIDFREKAPLRAFEEMFIDSNGKFDINLSTDGITAAGVPGSVAGLLYALEKYGTMPLSEIIDPAIQLADNGFILTPTMAAMLNRYRDSFSKYPSAKKIFVKDGSGFAAGDTLIQKNLAKTLTLIKNNGRDGFYKGEVAKLIAEQSDRDGGYISIEDLEQYKPVERKPVTGTYKEYDIISMGPTSSGGISLIQALNAIENIDLSNSMPVNEDYIFTVTEILKHVYANRSKHLGDMDFYDVPIDYLTSKEYGKIIASGFENYAVPSKEIKPVILPEYESKETTHFCVLDEEGNAVSLTTTINGLFGNKVVVEGAGFFLNNEMDDFSAQPNVPNSDGLLGSVANSIQPGKRMLSSMTPTIVLKDNKPVLIVGARGGSTIITTVLQIVMNVLQFDMNIQEAIDLPRFHHQWSPDRIDYEDGLLSEDLKMKLSAKGEIIGRLRELGMATGIQVDYNKNIIYGAPDKRGDGKALGY